MGAKTDPLVRCPARARPNSHPWFNTLLWIVSLLQLLIGIGRGVISNSQSSTRQTQHPVEPQLPLRRSQDVSNDRVLFISSEPINRGPGANLNDSAIEASWDALRLEPEQPAPRTRSGHLVKRAPSPSQLHSNVGRPYVDPRPSARILLYGAESEGEVFIRDMRKLARACCKHLRGRAQVDDRVVMGDMGFEFGTFLNQTNVRVEDMYIFGVSGHGRIWSNLVTFCLSANISVSFQDILRRIQCLPFHCTIEMFLDVCHASMAAEQHGLYKIWPSDELLSSPNLREDAERPRVGPKIVLWAAAGRQGVAYFRPGKHSYMLAATCKTLDEHASNLTRRELYSNITERLEKLNKKQQRKDKAPQIPVIFSSIPDRDRVLDSYALQPLLLGYQQETV